MRQILLCIVIVLTLYVCDGLGQKIVSPKPLILHLSRDSDPGSLWIEYCLTGTFGAYGSFVKTDSKTWDYKIPVSQDGKSAENVKVIVNGPKYKTAIFDFAKNKPLGRGIDLKLESRATRPFSGKVSFESNVSRQRLQVSIGYIESWSCSFLGFFDCFIGLEPITSVDLDSDGRFKAELPDFAGDAAIATYTDKGEFQFIIRDKQTGNRLYSLQPENGRKGLPGIAVAIGYPSEQAFIAEPWK